jgi:putative membrane protein insertion efficiency factor
VNDDERFQDASDAELVEHMAGSLPQQHAVFAEIYRRHSTAVLALCGGKLQDPDSALDAASQTFAVAWTALTSGRPIEEPHKLRAWLNGIAYNRCREEWRRRNRIGEMPDDDIEDDSYERASRARRAQVDRILDIVAASFTEREQQVFHFSVREGLIGQNLASALGVSEKEANDATYENINLGWRGFGAYILARDGRAQCPGLAAILDQYAWDGQTLTRTLRLRILRHLDTCATCDNCTICNAQRERLIAPYAPALIPILLLPSLDREIHDAIIGGGTGRDPLSHINIRRRDDKDPPDWQAQRRTARNDRTPEPPPLIARTNEGPPVSGPRGDHSPTPSLPRTSDLAASAASANPGAESVTPSAPRSDVGSHLVDAGVSAATEHGAHHACDGCDPCDGDCAPFFIASFLVLLASMAAGVGNVLRRRIPVLRHRRSKGTQAALAAIVAYRRWLSHRLPIRCRYIPSCSAFGIEAIQRYGLERGGRLTANRIRSCRSTVAFGTIDPVEAHASETGAARGTGSRVARGSNAI